MSRSLTTLIIAGLLYVSGGAGTVQTSAEDNLATLPSELEGGPATQMVSRDLQAQVETALARRDAEYEKLKTDEQVAAYQTKLRDFFPRTAWPAAESNAAEPPNRRQDRRGRLSHRKDHLRKPATALRYRAVVFADDG